MGRPSSYTPEVAALTKFERAALVCVAALLLTAVVYVAVRELFRMAVS